MKKLNVTGLKPFLVIILIAVCSIWGIAHAGKPNPTAVVSWAELHQTIDGFGASTAWRGSLTEAQADLFFSPTLGVGLSLVRERVPPTGTIESCTIFQQAIARGAKGWATPWTPPAAMKTNNDTKNGGSLLTTSYQAYADYLADYVTNVKTQCGVDLYALSIANEPDQTTTYESSTWTGAQFLDFIKNNLGPTFATRGITTQILMPEHSAWNFTMADPTLNDSIARNYVQIAATHNYSGTPSNYALAQSLGKRVWETEVSDFGTPDLTMTSGLKYAKIINDTMTIANANAWHYWWLIDNNSATGNQGLTNGDGTIAKRLYVLGNYSKFVRPGWTRIGATASPVKNVYVSAYKNSITKEFAVVAVNNNLTATAMNISLSGVSSSALTPWVTSQTLDLVVQPTLNSSNNIFSPTLAASSVTTFVGTGI